MCDLLHLIRSLDSKESQSLADTSTSIVWKPFAAPPSSGSSSLLPCPFSWTLFPLPLVWVPSERCRNLLLDSYSFPRRCSDESAMTPALHSHFFLEKLPLASLLPPGPSSCPHTGGRECDLHVSSSRSSGCAPRRVSTALCHRGIIGRSDWRCPCSHAAWWTGSRRRHTRHEDPGTHILSDCVQYCQLLHYLHNKHYT